MLYVKIINAVNNLDKVLYIMSVLSDCHSNYDKIHFFSYQENSLFITM